MTKGEKEKYGRSRLFLVGLKKKDRDIKHNNERVKRRWGRQPEKNKGTGGIGQKFRRCRGASFTGKHSPVTPDQKQKKRTKPRQRNHVVGGKHGGSHDKSTKGATLVQCKNLARGLKLKKWGQPHLG